MAADAARKILVSKGLGPLAGPGQSPGLALSMLHPSAYGLPPAAETGHEQPSRVDTRPAEPASFRRTNRRRLLPGSAISMAISEAWSVVTPVEAGFAPDIEDRLELARQAGTLPNLHGVVAARAGRIFLERYFAGPDTARARPLGVIRFGPDTLHDLRSVTKSIVGLLYGIALAAGQVPAPDAYLLEQFPEYPELGGEAARRLLTVRHALTMTLGTEWDELTLPYTHPRNSEIAMDRADDRTRYVLDRPIVGPPGVRWIYNGGATALLAAPDRQGNPEIAAGLRAGRLVRPLGNHPYRMGERQDGEAIAASGLRMTPRDLARIGAALLNAGVGTGARSCQRTGWRRPSRPQCRCRMAGVTDAIGIWAPSRWMTARAASAGRKRSAPLAMAGSGFSCCPGWNWPSRSRPAITTYPTNGGHRW